MPVRNNDSDHQPQGSQPETTARDIPLAGGIAKDGSLHVYVHDEDSGLRIWLDEKDGLVVQVDESVRLAAKRGD